MPRPRLQRPHQTLPPEPPPAPADPPPLCAMDHAAVQEFWTLWASVLGLPNILPVGALAGFGDGYEWQYLGSGRWRRLVYNPAGDLRTCDRLGVSV